MPDAPQAAHARLEGLGLIARTGEGWKTTRRWQGAMARAALRLLADGMQEGALSIPVAMALVELLGPSQPDEEMVELVEAMLPIERGQADATGESRAPDP